MKKLLTLFVLLGITTNVFAGAYGGHKYVSEEDVLCIGMISVAKTILEPSLHVPDSKRAFQNLTHVQNTFILRYSEKEYRGATYYTDKVKEDLSSAVILKRISVNEIITNIRHCSSMVGLNF
jgi:hypothetical protein